LFTFKRVFFLCVVVEGSGMAMPHWDFIGSTMVTPKFVRLTPDSQSKQGALWNSVVSAKIQFIVSQTCPILGL
jgi:mannose-binding lectin 2